MKPYFVFLLVGCLVLSACEMTDIETIGDAETVKSIQDKALSFNNRTEYLAEWQNYIDAKKRRNCGSGPKKQISIKL